MDRHDQVVVVEEAPPPDVGQAQQAGVNRYQHEKDARNPGEAGFPEARRILVDAKHPIGEIAANTIGKYAIRCWLPVVFGHEQTGNSVVATRPASRLLAPVLGPVALCRRARGLGA